ncbi:MAG: hypothetical protein ABIG03_07165 [Candidatus Eisenbacteria bacterium]
MSDERPRPETGDIEERPTDEAAGGSDAGGWRSQPMALRVLFLASLLAIVAGVVRCAFEVTGSPADEAPAEQVESGSR